jgi:hypothetical protein
MSGTVPLIPLFFLLLLWHKCTLPHLFIPHSLCLVLFSCIYYAQGVIFCATYSTVSPYLKFGKPQKTVYITVELHLSESWLSLSQIVLFGLAFLINVSRILHNVLALNYRLSDPVQYRGVASGTLNMALPKLFEQLYNVNSNSQNSSCLWRLFSTTNSIIGIFCIYGSFAVQLNTDKCSSNLFDLLQNSFIFVHLWVRC